MNIKLRLIVMNFLEFAVWGAYLTSMGGYLARIGLGDRIWMFFAMQGVVSIFMPALVGMIADKWIPAQRMLSYCHALAGAFMLGVAVYAHGLGSNVDFGILFLLYSISVAFFMPTIAIANSVAYNALEVAGLDSVKHFPPIRVFGTVGFICCMLCVNFIRTKAGIQLQHSTGQFQISGLLSIVLSLYALTLTHCPCVGKGKKSKSFVSAMGLDAFKLFKQRNFAVFFIFSMLLGASLQITNGYANPFITHFKELPEYAGSWGANNANALISVDTVLYEAVRHQEGDADIDGGMGVAFWVVRSWRPRQQSVDAGVKLYCVWHGVRLLQYLRFALCGQEYRQRNTVVGPRSVHADDQRTWRFARHMGGRIGGEPFCIQCRRAQLECGVVCVCSLLVGCCHIVCYLL